MESLERTSVSDQVAAALREEILSGVLAPGASLREVALAERFDVSRGTVREAIRALVTDGLVTHHRHRGAEVVLHSADDVRDIFAARAAAEAAVADALDGAETPALHALRQSYAALEAAFAAADFTAATEADLAFHRALVGLTGSRRLASFYDHLQSELRLLLLIATRDDPDPDTLSTHRELLELATVGDAAAYRRAARAHVSSAERDLLAVLARRPPDR